MPLDPDTARRMRQSALGDYSGPTVSEHDAGHHDDVFMQVGLIWVCDSPSFPTSTSDGMR